jgi:hypothetical protein
MYQQLDDPVALPPSTREQRQATLIRGAALRRRRRRAMAVAIPFGAAAVAVAVAGLVALSSDPTRSTAPVPAATPSRSAVLPLGVRAAPADAAFGGCSDPVGDSVGDPDLIGVALDRPVFPFIHFHWDGSRLPRTGSVEALFWATSADGQRSRQLIVEIVDGKVVDQFVRDPDTGVEQTVVHDAFTDTTVDGVRQRAVELSADALGASFPGAAFSPLRDGWTFVASIKVDGAVVDSCDPKTGSTMGP